MNKALRFDPDNQTVALTRKLAATLQRSQDDPAIPVDGVTFGVASMSESAPHAGEMHPDGDEVLYLISGRARVTLETDPVQVLELKPGDGLLVPRGIWHRVDVLEPIQVVYVTPGPDNEYRALS